MSDPRQIESWLDPPLDVCLAVGEVHVWKAQLEPLPSRLTELHSLLTPTERARAERYVFEHDQANFILARGTLRHLLGRYLAQSPGEIAIETGVRGKPSIANSMNPQGLTFNISHSGGLCLLAIGRGRRLGIDVEKIRGDLDCLELAKRHFTAAEADALRSLPRDRRSLGFFLCWTRKEAYVKARGDGLQIPLDEFSVTVDPDLPARLTSPDSDLWQIASLSVDGEYTAAIVIERPVISVSLWNLKHLFES